MERRSFIQILAMLGASAAIPRNAFAFETKQPDAPWLSAYQGVQHDLPVLSLHTEGSWPTELTGTLYRNGPAMMQRAGERYHHWFDGDGMIQKFRINPDEITHQGRFVRTEKFVTEEAAGRFLYPVAGTYRANSLPVANNDSINVANTNIFPIADKLLALWEGGSATEIIPDTLDTGRLISWGEGMQHLPFSAHPIRDQDGSVWNMGSVVYVSPAKVVLYHLSATGKLNKMKLLELDFGGYMHDFAITDEYVVILNSSCVYGEGRTFTDSFSWQPQRASQLIVLSKHDFSVVAQYDIEPSFVFHFAGAYQRGQELVVNLSRYKNADIMLSAMKELLATGYANDCEDATLSQLVVNMQTGKSTLHDTGMALEFPAWDRRQPLAQASTYGVGTSGRSAKLLNDAVVGFNFQQQQQQHYHYGPGYLVEEPQFIAKANSKPGQGWLLHTLFDYQRRRSGLAVLDAQQLSKGPVAMAWTDRAIPLGFHGCFVPAKG